MNFICAQGVYCFYMSGSNTKHMLISNPVGRLTNTGVAPKGPYRFPMFGLQLDVRIALNFS